MMVHQRKMRFAKTLKHFLLVSLLPFTMHLQGNKTDVYNFTVEYLKATMNYSIGDTLVLNCTIKFFASKPPVMFWCKQAANICEPLHGINTTSKRKFDKRVFLVYSVSPINLTDSGKYQCQAKQSNITSKGHFITVNVNGVKTGSYETSTTVTPANSTMKIPNPANTPLWIFYCVIIVGIVGAVVFLIMITYFCIRNFHEPLDRVEPSNSSQKNQSHDNTEINGKCTIYENMNECSEGISSSSPNPLTVNECNSPRNQKDVLSNTAQHDTIIYASLNKSMLNRKPSMKFPNNEDTEYAAINIKH